MGELKVINEQEVLGKSFKIYESVENPLFLARDIAEWIDFGKTKEGYFDVSAMLRKIDDDEKAKIRTTINNPSGSDMWFLTEDGMYEVLMQSRKPKAKAFKKEIKQILKDIRKHGAYMTPEKIEEVLLNPDTIINLANQLKSERAERERLEKKITADAPKVLFANQLAKSKDLSPVGDYAKTLCTGGFEIGEIRLFKWLRDSKILQKNNIPYQRYIISGVFQVKKGVYLEGGVHKQYMQTLITPKGQLYLFKKMLKDPNLGLSA